MSFTHLDESGHARMVDVTGKQPTVRAASARAFVTMAPDTVAALRDGSVPKGDVLAVSRIAGIQAAKRTPELLPLAHVIGVHGVVVDLQIEDAGVSITATVRTADRTGVEMEALTAVTVAALSVVDMVKGIDRTVTITDAWVKAADSGMSAAFGELENSGDTDATIVSVSSDASSMMELHEVVDDGTGSMVMQEKDGGFVIPAGGSLTLEPGGYHFMLMDLTAPLVAGDEATFTVTFDDGSTMKFVAPVKDFTGADENYNDGGMDMGDDHSGMDMGGDE